MNGKPMCGYHLRSGLRTWALVLAALLLGCQNESPNFDEPISAYRDRMLVQHQNEPATAPTPNTSHPLRRDAVARPVPEQSQLPTRASLMTQPATTSQPSPADILAELPDPTEAEARFAGRLEQLRQEQEGRQDQRVVRNYERVVEHAIKYLQIGARKQQLRLSLSESVQRAIQNNYSIRIEAHNPAISQAQIVEAEAAFDAQFFLDNTWASVNQPVLPGIPPNNGQSDSRAVNAGFRQLLATGMQASVSLGTQRNWSGVSQGDVKTWNPQWPTNFIVSFRQPLLRGFGLDVNRSQIVLRQIGHQVSYETFIQRVRDTLLQVEQAYWQLALARRTTAIIAESVAQNLVTYMNMVERLDHDATQVEVENSKSQWQTSYVSFLETLKNVRDAEDALKNLMNDPTILLSEDVEIIPIETYCAAPTALDHFGEVRTALERRSEIRQAKQQIDATRVNTMLAKNAVLPQLDISFQYEVQGLGSGFENSFHNMTGNRFISYNVGASFTYYIGERQGRAQLAQATLRERQAVVALQQVMDSVVTEVNGAIRQIVVRYAQIPPALEAVLSAERNLRALQARTQKIDPSYLQTELSAVEQISNTRRTLLQAITDYNVGIVTLEKAKGTLLEYNNVLVVDDKPAKSAR